MSDAGVYPSGNLDKTNGRMRTVFRRDDIEGGHIVYNATLRAFAAHYSYQPKACRPYRAQTKGKAERPYR
jgi:transposase